MLLFYGNCQVWAIKETLNLPSIHSEIVMCWDTTLDENHMKELIQKADIIITQPIQDNYRNLPYLSSSYMIQNARPTTKIIMFDSCYFDFYYVDLTYKMINGKMLEAPHDYHYTSMIENYKQLSVDTYIEKYIENPTLFTPEQLEQRAETSLQELYRRYLQTKELYPTVWVITSYEFIRDHYKDQLLFYSMNHPTNYVFQNLCDQINALLQWNHPINLETDVLSVTKCILYACVQPLVRFKLTNPKLGELTNVKDIVQLYFDTYQLNCVE